MITAEEILMGRDVLYPLSDVQKANLLDLLPRVNTLRGIYGKPMSLSSGYRPDAINSKVPNAAPRSAHTACQAIDVKDPKGEFALWCLANLDVLARLGLFMEDPRWTPGWVHLDSRGPKSGKRVFVPDTSPALQPNIWDGKYDKKYDKK